MDIRELTGEELEDLRISIGVEIERRQSLETIPVQIAGLTATYLAAGGDPDELTAKVS